MRFYFLNLSSSIFSMYLAKINMFFKNKVVFLFVFSKIFSLFSHKLDHEQRKINIYICEGVVVQKTKEVLFYFHQNYNKRRAYFHFVFSIVVVVVVTIIIHTYQVIIIISSIWFEFKFKRRATKPFYKVKDT